MMVGGEVVSLVILCSSRADRAGASPASHAAARFLQGFLPYMRNRSKVRNGLKVIHRHKVGEHTYRRVSELVYVRGEPRALLGWIDIGGLRTPIYVCILDREKLHPAAAPRTFYYDEVTVDPRYEDANTTGA